MPHITLWFRSPSGLQKDAHSAGRKPHPIRKTDEQKKAALQQRIAALREKVQRIERRENEQARRARAHVGIVIGWGIIEHALAHPHSEVRRVAVRLIEAHLRERPDDKPVDALLERLKTAGKSTEAAE